MVHSMNRIPSLLLALAVSGASFAQTGLDLMDVDIMFVGAHPDDDTGILATFARYLLDEGFRGTVVTATGGDGGGNAIGVEAGRSLALIRKEEERRALALVGVDSPSFLGLSDFYFTLSAEEAERKWGESFVCDVVRHVRLERPEVLLTMWPGPGTHGQHQMAARAATLAFEKAPDPAFCPELYEREFLQPFTPLKLYYYDRGGPTAVEIPASDYSPSLYRSYAEIKSLATSMYRSQGFDRLARVPVENPGNERFLLVRSRVPVALPETHLLAGASPAEVELQVEPESFRTGVGESSSVEVTLLNRGKTYPSGASRDTSTTLQAAAFPCTTEGFGARGFRDADAHQGLMEDTAPGMEVASRKIEGGYTLEAKIPWSVMPREPQPGDEIGLNVVVYDGDARDARVGANVSESGIAWAAFEWGGKQALPYLWPRAVLAR
jgi:LmbE family N-acetylglucosaminyl deacetylase